MMAATFESAGICASRSGDAEDVGSCVLVDVELDDLHLAVGEDVGLSRRGHADDAADRVRRLELGRDDEVDVELALAPELDVLDVRRADHRRCARGVSRRANMPATRFTSSRDVQAMTRSALSDSGRCEVLAARPVALERRDVEAAGERLEARRLGVDHGDLVLVVERLDDRRADLPRADRRRSSRARSLLRLTAAHRGWLPWCRAALSTLAVAVAGALLLGGAGSASAQVRLRRSSSHVGSVRRCW